MNMVRTDQFISVFTPGATIYSRSMWQICAHFVWDYNVPTAKTKASYLNMNN